MKPWSVALLVTLILGAFAVVMASADPYASEIKGKAIQHNYIMALQADTPKSTRDAIIETLESQGAKITTLIDYPGIMQAINFEDSSAMAASGQTDLSTAEARISAWQASVSSFGDAVHSVEQDKIVVAQ